MAALDASKPPLGHGPGEVDNRLAAFQVSNVPTVYYLQEWVTPEEEADFIRFADTPTQGINPWEQMKTRSSQEWGAGDRCGCGRGLMREPLPPWLQGFADALNHLGVFDGELYPMNSVRINGYSPGQGISPHCDGPVYFPKVAILSLGSPCIFSFYPKTGTEDNLEWDRERDVPGGSLHVAGTQPLASFVLEPRSLLIFGDDAFWHHRHGIADVASDELTESVSNLHMVGKNVGDVIPRSRRVSLTMRHLLPRCSCQGWS